MLRSRGEQRETGARGGGGGGGGNGGGGGGGGGDVLESEEYRNSSESCDLIQV